MSNVNEGSTGWETKQDGDNDRQLMLDMESAYEQYTTKSPTTAAVSQSAGNVAKGVFSGLQNAGFSFFTIVSKLYVVFDLIQKHGADIKKIVDEFKNLFSGNQGEQK